MGISLFIQIVYMFNGLVISGGFGDSQSDMMIVIESI